MTYGGRDSAVVVTSAPPQTLAGIISLPPIQVFPFILHVFRDPFGEMLLYTATVPRGFVTDTGSRSEFVSMEMLFK